MRTILSIAAILMTLSLPLFGKPDTPYDPDTVVAYDHILSPLQQDIVDELYESLSAYDYSITFSKAVREADLDAAIEHILTDYPELFHVDLSYQYWYREDGWIESVDFQSLMGKRQAKKYQKDLFDVAYSLVSQLPEDADDFYKEVLLHDTLCAYIDYSLEDELDYTAVGALLYGRAACEGYAEAFALLLRLAGIPCSAVGGIGGTGDDTEPHAWNIVSIDGDYALVDVTWDDGDEYISHGWFNITSEEMSRDHNPDAIYESLPQADSPQLSWFAVMGLEVPGAVDDVELARWLIDTSLAEEGPIEVRFSDAAEYEDFSCRFGEIAEECAAKYGLDVALTWYGEPVQQVFTLEAS